MTSVTDLIGASDRTDDNAEPAPTTDPETSPRRAERWLRGSANAGATSALWAGRGAGIIGREPRPGTAAEIARAGAVVTGLMAGMILVVALTSWTLPQPVPLAVLAVVGLALSWGGRRNIPATPEQNPTT